MKSKRSRIFIVTGLILAAVLFSGTDMTAFAQGVDGYTYKGDFNPMDNVVTTKDQFNGYTNYWHDLYWKWYSYGNLFQLSAPNLKLTIAQNKLDTAEELGLPGMWMQEGFVNGLLAEPYRVFEQPSLQVLEESLSRGNLLVYADPATAVGQKLLAKAPPLEALKAELKSHQFNAEHFHEVRLFVLENAGSRLFVVSSICPKCRNRVRELIGNVESVLEQYDMHRGWFGTATLLHSVTCYPLHPLEVIGKGMNQGNSFFTFSGYMDYMTRYELPDWLSKVNLSIATDGGTSKATHNLGTVGYGFESWDDLKIQDMPTEEEWIKFVKDQNGYIFRPVYADECNPYHYDGYIAIEGNKQQIDNENVPFILETGYLSENAPPCMVLFINKGEQLTRERMWGAITGRREVGILPKGLMMGPALYRNVLQMLLIDRAYLEEYYGDRISIEAKIEGRELTVNITNTYAKSVSGSLAITPAPELVLRGSPTTQVIMPAKSSKTLKFAIQPTLAAMDRTNPVAVNFTWDDNKKGTLAIMDLPRAISVHQLLYGHAPNVTYPVSVHNFSGQQTFPVKVQVLEKNNPSSVVYEAVQQSSAAPGKHQDLTFVLQIPSGEYNVKVSALGAENISQLGVGKQEGAPYLYTVDLNGDGIDEYRMENDQVQVTLLSIGARVIEYIVKERNDNVLFKLWPEKEDSDKRPFREQGFYPYGGFEDFLGQASVETHTVYDAEIVKSEGDYVQVKMVADYFGNRLEKIFTLYGDSPLLEVRFALTFVNPEMNMLGPQPILSLGQRHWTEDEFILPTTDGIYKVRMRPEEFFGKVHNMKEGWNAGYDTKEDITFVGAFPVTEPLFNHMWMNHPANSESHHYYAEFQPWVPIYQKTTMYFTYYLWGKGGPWEAGVKALRDRNLISTR